MVVPLVKKFDKRTNTERYTISKKQYIRDKIHLSELQDKYHKRLTDKGYDLERGIKGSDRKNIKIKEYKKINRKLEENLNVRNNRLDKVMSEFDEKMKTTKNIPFNKNQVIVNKDTFDTINKVINESKKIRELQHKIEQVFNEVNNYASSYKSLEKENQNIKREVKSLKTKNEKLENENRNLQSWIMNMSTYEHNDKTLGIEVSTSIDVLALEKMNYTTTIETSVLQDLNYTTDNTMLKLYECLSVIGTLMKDGVIPNSSKMDGRIFKRYNKALEYLLGKLGMDYDTAISLINYFIMNEQNIDNKESHERIKELILKR